MPSHSFLGLRRLLSNRAIGDEVMTDIGKKYGKSAGQVSLRWLIQKGAFVIPRTSKVERLSENMSV